MLYFKESFKAIQFNLIDGIDGPLTQQLAQSLGLSQNKPSSTLWEIKIKGSWKITNHSDWIIFNDQNTIIDIYTNEEFNQNYIANVCDVCLGHPLPNQNCICNGTGTLIDLLTGLRKLIYNLQNQLP
jgi:hypothetical protein